MINSPASVEYIKTIHPDLIVVAAFSPILKSALLGIPPKGCLNLHASLLPKYRGPNPFYWVLKNNEARTGATVHYMDTRIDSGDIILQKEIPITLRDTELTLRDKSVSVGSQLLLEAIHLIDEGTAQRVKQIEEEASYYPIPPRGKSLL